MISIQFNINVNIIMVSISYSHHYLSGLGDVIGQRRLHQLQRRQRVDVAVEQLL